MAQNEITKISTHLKEFLESSSEILGAVESSKTRQITLDQSYKNISGLSLKQDDLFRQSLRCVEVGVFRAAHVMAWAGFVDCLQGLLASDGFKKLNSAFSSWKIESLDQLRESRTEFALIEALHAMGVVGKSERKAFHGMLSKRNECAHPADYFPSFNETLGYISELFSRLKAIENRYPSYKL